MSRHAIPSVSERAASLKLTGRLKMARSAHAYVRGNTQQFYDWLDASPAGVPQGPPIWICGDCHLGNLGPFADVRGEVEVQIRALDPTVIGNPAHDIIRLGLSLASTARDSSLPSVATARMLGQLMQRYDQGLEMNPDDGSTDILKPPGDPNSVERSIKRRSFGTRAETAFLKFCYNVWRESVFGLRLVPVKREQSRDEALDDC